MTSVKKSADFCDRYVRITRTVERFKNANEGVIHFIACGRRPAREERRYLRLSKSRRNANITIHAEEERLDGSAASR